MNLNWNLGIMCGISFSFQKPGFEDSAANVKGGSQLEIVSNLLMVRKALKLELRTFSFGR